MKIITIAIATLMTTHVAQASNGLTSNPNVATDAILWIAILLVLAKISSLVERFGQPAVLGELVMGIILGNLTLIGLNAFEPIKHNEIISFFAELGVIILLFQIGLESDTAQMRKVGVRAFFVAVVGVTVPFILGYLGALVFWPQAGFQVHLFLGATLTATSVGITARVFKDLGKLQTPEAQIILGAAVIDDILGLIILAVVTAIVTQGTVSIWGVSVIMGKAMLFLLGALAIGQFSANIIGKLFSKINMGIGMKFTMAISFCLFLAYLAKVMGLAPIVGAFTAGLVLDPVHFRHFKVTKIVEDLQKIIKTLPSKKQPDLRYIIEKHTHRHVEKLIEPLSFFFVPIFFVYTGIHVDLAVLFDFHVLFVALAITVIAFGGKLVAGLAAGNVNKWLVGWGMAPRGEVGLIFLVQGQQLGVILPEQFSEVVIMVILTTLLTPLILNYLIKQAEMSKNESLPKS